MAASRDSTRLGTSPSPGDLELLSVLWDHGPLSLSQVYALLPDGPGYTTVQTRLNRLVDKGLAKRFKQGRQPMHYEALATRAEVSAWQVENVALQVAPAHVAPLMAHLVQGAELTEADLKELKAIVKQAELRLEQQRRGI